ncbi:MAG TPA: hypothetical protein VGP77_15880 [Vicinamibacterales bacterium]|jgi:hypothetical protein|nr:hypothetical protein [Vicinamibacterales bacterium]
MRKKKWVFIVPAAILGILLFGFLGGEVVKQLWNWLMPPLFGWREVTFWQALGLLALCRILFGGHGYRSPHSRRGTPEERERFRKAVRARFGFSPSTSESPTP